MATNTKTTAPTAKAKTKAPATKSAQTKAAPATKEATVPGLPEVTVAQAKEFAKANAPAAKPAKARVATTAKDKEEARKKVEGESTPAAQEKPKAVRTGKPKTYIRKDRTRRATGSRVQVLELTAPDAPADAIKPKAEDGKAYNFAAHCATHNATAFHETYGSAYKDSKVSHEWCGKCKLVNADALTKGK